MTLRSQKHFVFIIGTRAQLIKVAPVIVECERMGLPSTLLMTGQHQETMQDLLDEFGVKSAQVTATFAKEHSTILSLITWLPMAYLGIKKQLKALSTDPKFVNILVHGDTLSTVLGALVGRQIGGCVVHLESGLTSNKIFDPFPEELSRRIVFRLSNIAMCPNPETVKHMRTKHPDCQSIDTGGNTILDSIKLTGISRATFNLESSYIVASLHRFQNIYNTRRLADLVELLENIAKTHLVYFVLHPATRKRLTKTGLLERLETHIGIILLPRLGYSDFLRLAAESACVLTDGGSNQEELASLGVPTIVMRQATERSDGLGKNAILEGELSSGVLSYIEQKRYQALKTPSNDEQAESPSACIMDYLANNA
ncbi:MULTISPECIES: UDP-N-acetylglucosamine 2-epimerase [unclassified Marinobacter]|uniref:UDP-N-acetylglucosamine 2-epimerase n=1 Tax=unclassified Marinobacter TaxID=83889 RepID=UPI00200D673C|nr:MULTISPECIES: UDP-N-acetylglucosamine 2-epimerase [unclassified Marinobacter]UQG57001.1 UDP-N-acetylglucosamine 2-epimerase [Marinobacter sp. M4C]UQG65805.1 UDP-N-acetylglucosamine 2-epimerase [Marinobacter sp. M2C]UQG70085.1 UDP-N-acetylglucosamine 2-epimerase [Marinobacter sp. M1C]